MKHSWKIIALLLGMFLLAQLIGLGVIHAYKPILQSTIVNGTQVNTTLYHLPYGFEPPQNTSPRTNTLSIIIAFVIAVVLILVLITVRAELVLRFWFFTVVVIALSITLNAFLKEYTPFSALVSFILVLPLGFLKVFKRNILIHNITEVFIYPGLAAVFVPLLSVWTTGLLLIFISVYDVYAVWHATFMLKMAKYQIQKLKVFSGFLVPYLSKKERRLFEQTRSLKAKNKKVKVSVAILGGGDVVFPLILAGVVLNTFSLLPASIIVLGATIALGTLFYFSEKGKAYPAMPFITAGCFIALGIVYLI